MFNTWYVAGTSNEMKEYPVNRKILGEEITLFRDTDGHLNALQDLCPHRGARLSHGSMKNGLLTCPFHGWQFSGDGSCRHIPANGIHAPIPSGARVKSFPVCEEAGYVWVFMGNHADMKPLKLPEEIRDPAWRKVPFETQWATDYTRVVESTLDVSHLPFVHRESTGPNVDPAVEGPSFQVNGDTIVVEAKPYRKQVQSEPTKAVEISTITLLFPNLLILRTNVHADQTMATFLALTPIDHDQTLIYGLALRNFLIDFEPLDVFHCEHNLQVLEQDRVVVEGLRPKSVPLDLRAEQHVRSDGPQVRFRLMLRRALQHDAKLLGFQTVNGGYN